MSIRADNPRAAGLEAVLPCFEAFQAARLDFAHDLGELAIPPERQGLSSNVPGGSYEVDGPEKVLEALERSDTLAASVAGLADDLAPSVRQSSMVAMGRLCLMSEALRAKVASPALIEEVVKTIAAAASPALLKTAMFLLHGCVRSPGAADAAQAAVEANALPALCERLEDADSSVKAAAVWCLAGIATHNAELAAEVANCGALPLLMLCAREPSLPLVRVAISCFGTLGKHDAAGAARVQSEGAVELAAKMLKHRDALLRRHACRLLALCLQHPGASPAARPPATSLPRRLLTRLPPAGDEGNGWLKKEAQDEVLVCMAASSDNDAELGTFASALAAQLMRRSSSIAQEYFDKDVLALLVVQLSQATGGGSPLQPAAALTALCNAVPEAAAAAVKLRCVKQLCALLDASIATHVGAKLCAAVAAIANADADCADAVAKAGGFRAMAHATFLSNRRMSAATTTVAADAIATAVGKTTNFKELSWLVEALPFPSPEAARAAKAAAADADDGAPAAVDDPKHVAAVLKALGTLLGAGGKEAMCIEFGKRGSLAKAQQAKHGGPLCKEGLKVLNGAFPKNMVDATDPNYERELLKKLPLQ